MIDLSSISDVTTISAAAAACFDDPAAFAPIATSGAGGSMVSGVDVSQSPPTLTVAGQSYALNQITQVLSTGTPAK